MTVRWHVLKDGCIVRSFECEGEPPDPKRGMLISDADWRTTQYRRRLLAHAGSRITQGA